MIVVKLQGGLGNQMFQYAFARSLSLKTGQPFALDTVELEKGEGITRRRYELSAFNINPKLLTEEESIYAQSNYNIIKESPSSVTSNNIEPIHEDTYCYGYWQSENYFKEHAADIRVDFTLKNPLGEQASKLVSQVNITNSIVIQVRRGDYVSNEKVARIMSNCEPDYYQRAIKYLMKDSSSTEIFIVSDDIDWCRRELVFPVKTVYISEYRLLDSEELFLMTRAKNIVISNSTFGWWGAWLNNEKEKVIIAPKNWFRETSMEKVGLVPDTWLRL